ncbi:hypothetical protein CPB84DRAFT_1816492 [Gymnopilus junonius]|uniref:3'-5' exonuclease domain-containing protein n=1 Tax=Gymnopilus junonius TaxID=109634 RepID=A0A9P5TJN0_GYMJU|nr:hypothetical protein CPB84DRAFT_1816492 [Gymnopilus junonius]
MDKPMDMNTCDLHNSQIPANAEVLNNNVSQSGQVLGWPPKDSIRLTTEVQTVHDANRSFPTTAPQPLSHEETENYVLPACQSLPRVNEQDGKDESDDSLAAGDSDGVNGDAANENANFDNGDEPIGQISSLVMDAFKKKINYLKKLTEGHGSNTKILVYEKLDPVCTFSSCHPLVMAKLPKPLAAQFPAYLTKCSGLSKQVFSIMQCCFQNSMGGKQFADSLNVLYQYFHELLEIEAHEKEFDQYTAQLSCHRIAIDHSHKITKQIAKILVCHTTSQINNTILSPIDLFSTSDRVTFVVGLDTEWDVNLAAQRQGIPDCHKTAIMQITYRNNVWIFQLSDHINQGTFPAQLLTFLENPQILKVGCNVLLDLKNLQDDKQIQYAALDAYASLKIYEKLNTLQVPILVNFKQKLPSDYEVFIFHDDCTTIIAHGIISPDQFNSFQGIC